MVARTDDRPTLVQINTPFFSKEKSGYNYTDLSRDLKYLFAYQCRRLITFAISLDTDQDLQNVGLIWIKTIWRVSNSDSDGIPARIFMKKLILKKSADDQKACKITQHAKSKTHFLRCIIMMKAPTACRHMETLSSWITSCIGPPLLKGSISRGIHIHPRTKYANVRSW